MGLLTGILAVRQRMTAMQLTMLQAHCRSTAHSISTNLGLVASLLLVLWDRHQLVQTPLDLVVPATAQKVTPFRVFVGHLHQFFHLAAYVVEYQETAINAGRRKVSVIKDLAGAEIIYLAAFLAWNTAMLEEHPGINHDSLLPDAPLLPLGLAIKTGGKCHAMAVKNCERDENRRDAA